MSIDLNGARNQWYLDGTGAAGFKTAVHLNLGEVWSETGGAGLKVVIVDDGVDTSHSQLSGSISDAYGATERAAGADGNPTASKYGHGTAVAGIIAAEASNSSPVGIAPGVELASLRIFGTGNLSLSNALGHLSDFDIANNSWGYSISFYKADNIGHLTYWRSIESGLDEAVTVGRDGLGTIIVKSAGNSREDGRIASDDYVANHEGVIVVGAIDHTGEVSYYSTPGANILVSAPSSGAGKSVTTIDRAGSAGYSSGSTTDAFGGTSAAAPMVTGVVALMLEANPALTYQEVQDILAMSARHTGSDIGHAPSGNELYSWATNGATQWNGGGMHYSNDYGFGLLDAHQAVRLAETWSIGRDTNVTLKTGADTGAWFVNPATGVARSTLVVSDTLNIQSVVLTLESPVSFQSIEGIVLVSPDGTQHTLFESAGAEFVSSGSYSWDFLAQGFRGESATGIWTVEVDFGGQTISVSQLDASLAISGQAESENDVHYYTSEYAEFSSGTLRDTIGTDTINTAAISEAVEIDLTPGAVSTIDGASLRIFEDTVIEQVVTGDGDDTITGNDAANLIWSGRGNDTVSGGAGNDFFFEGQGDDFYDGGAGTDFVFIDSDFEADLFSFGKITGTDNIMLVHSNEINTLQSVERLAFADGTQIAFDNDGNAGQIYRIYETAFNRTPDAAGFEAWLQKADDGADLFEIAQSFVLSQEFSDLYNGFDSVEEKVAAFYLNSLDRAPDAEGLAAWAAAYGSDAVDDGQILLGFSESAEKIILSEKIFDDGFIF